MATIFSHIAVPIALRLGLGSNVISTRLMIAGAVGSVLPDADMIGFFMGVDYGSEWGHRGFSHSIAMAIILGGIATLGYRGLKSSPFVVFAFISLSVLSHGVLDSLTTGGHGTAFLWPLSDERYFLPWQFIKVSPIGMGFFSERGLMVIVSELKWVWCPLITLALAGFGLRHWLNRNKTR